MKSETIDRIRNTALEEAARICDEDARMAECAFHEHALGPEPTREKKVMWAASVTAAEECARKIRALKKAIIAALFATACGPAFTESLFEGEQDAALANPESGMPDVRTADDVQKETVDAATVEDSTGLQDVVGDASAGPTDAASDTLVEDVNAAAVTCGGVECPPCGAGACCTGRGECGCNYSVCI